MATHVVVHQFDPLRDVPGGIEGYISGLMRHAPPDVSLALVGVQSPRAPGKLGHWQTLEVGERRVAFMPVARIEPLHRRAPNTAKLVAGLLRYRPSLADTVVHCHRADVGAVVSLLVPRTPMFQFVHWDAADALRFGVESYWRFLPRLYFAMERRAVRHAVHTVAMNASAVERLRSYSPNVSLGGNWFDGDVFHCGEGVPADGVPVIGWAARLDPQKDPRKAVEVLRLLKRRGFAFRAWIAGDGSLAEDVARLIDRAELTEEVQMLGPLSPDDLGDRLRRTRVFLMTSLWEGTPRSVIEALACGVPVVSPDVGELRSLVSDGTNGFLSSPDAAPEELADRVVDALTIQPGGDVARTVSELEAATAVPKLFAEIARRLDPILRAPGRALVESD